jgi:hypothetical protein
LECSQCSNLSDRHDPSLRGEVSIDETLAVSLAIAVQNERADDRSLPLLGLAIEQLGDGAICRHLATEFEELRYRSIVVILRERHGCVAHDRETAEVHAVARAIDLRQPVLTAAGRTE